MPARIRRRDGSETGFDGEKIANAIRRAGQVTGEFGADQGRLLSAQVVEVLSHGHFGAGIPGIERIQGHRRVDPDRGQSPAHRARLHQLP